MHHASLLLIDSYHHNGSRSDREKKRRQEQDHHGDCVRAVKDERRGFRIVAVGILASVFVLYEGSTKLINTAIAAEKRILFSLGEQHVGTFTAEFVHSLFTILKGIIYVT